MFLRLFEVKGMESQSDVFNIALEDHRKNRFRFLEVIYKISL